jgi:signal transduction histidine kinase
MMTKTLRLRIIAVAMASILTVLAVIIVVANLITFAQVRKDADRLLEILVQNGGGFSKAEDFDTRPWADGNEQSGLRDGKFSAETPYETRYFYAIIDSDGTAWINAEHIAALTTDEMQAYLTGAYYSSFDSGYLDNYRFLRKENESGTLVVMLDCTRQLTTARTFLRSSILISLLGSCAVFVLVLLLSRIVVRPVEESYAKQKRFITDSGHELKTPLAVISANTEVLEMEYGENEWTLSIKHQVARMTELTSRLTQLARMDEQEKIKNFERVGLSELATQTVSSFVAAAEQAGKSLSADVAPDIAVRGNRELLSQLLTILLDNAVKYADRQITLTLQQRGQRVLLSTYNDVTEPVSVGELEHFFDRFYRGDSSRSSRVPGFGIGLSLARSIVENHGGSIRARSDDGHSVTFTVTLKGCDDEAGQGKE